MVNIHAGNDDAVALTIVGSYPSSAASCFGQFLSVHMQCKTSCGINMGKISHRDTSGHFYDL